ncbi:hypothetical protein N474_25560 [Pseudoalteromonas luteoviolacea CPMOR-2]|uniref:hypothetical protein n=1 Tax=Pseudoalteromonas luteoviolacea TaxID=43657 RepID=UPI0007B0A133|nr:hypothetical protein [Pseudoalteromonas luteoviolacea]KZN58420.1 hypothetical protein N474_25560 [Pseudoalteromonas luteoviolacea CPMOR-2]
MREAREVFEEIKVLYGFKNLTELSKFFGKNGNWAASMIKNESIPYPQCAQVCTEKNVSMDWLLFDKKGQSIERSELLELIQEGLFESKELAILEDLTLEQLKATSVLVLKQIESIINTTNNITSKNNKTV